MDLLRFIAASAVVLYHFTYRPLVGAPAGNGTFGSVELVTRFGYLGVNLFFMLSGFVILWSSQGRTAPEFVVSRFARLFPSFWICLILTTLVVNLSGSGEPISARTFAANVTMIPGLLGASYVDGVYWTLFVELKFYFLVFALLISGTMGHVERWIGALVVVYMVCTSGVAPHWLASLTMFPLGTYFISGCLCFADSSAWAVCALSRSCALGLLCSWHPWTQLPSSRVSCKR